MASGVPRGLDPVGVRIALEGGKHWGASDQARYDAWARSRGKSSPSPSSRGGNPWPSNLDPNLARQALQGGSSWGPNDQARYNALVRQRQQGNSRPAPSPSPRPAPRPAPSGGGGSYGTRASNIPKGLDPNLVRQALGGGSSWGPNDQARYNALVRQKQQGNRGPSPSPSPSGGGGGDYGTRARNIPSGLNPTLVRQALGGGSSWGPNDQKRYDALARQAAQNNRGPSPAPSGGGGGGGNPWPAGLNPDLARQALEGGKHWGESDQKRYDALVKQQGGGTFASTEGKPFTGGGSSSSSQGNLLSQSTMDEVSAGIGTMFQGQSWGNSLMQDLFTNGGTEDDDGRRAMRDAFQFDVASKFFNTQLGMAQSEFNLAQNKEGMSFANNLDRQTGQEARSHIHSLNMMQMDKQYQLNNQFAQHDYNRGIGMLAAQGEQLRKNYAAEGEQNRLNTITTGEQMRQNMAAQGDQDRRTTVIQGEQQRQNYAAQGVEQRKNIAATGVENRLQAATEGEQQRLNIGKTAYEERSTMTHSDDLMARREKRQNARARANVRDF